MLQRLRVGVVAFVVSMVVGFPVSSHAQVAQDADGVISGTDRSNTSRPEGISTGTNNLLPGLEFDGFTLSQQSGKGSVKVTVTNPRTTALLSLYGELYLERMHDGVGDRILTVTSSDIFSLTSLEAREVIIPFELPAGSPGGKYHALFVVKNESTMPLASQVASFTYDAPDAGFTINWKKAFVVVGSRGVFSNLEGPTIEKSEEVAGMFSVENASTAPLALTPRITVYDRDPSPFDTPIAEWEGDVVTAKPLGASGARVPLSREALLKPASYVAKMVLMDKATGNQSPEVLFRWVVGGEGARVLLSTYDLTPGALTHTLNLATQIVGPADGTSIRDASIKYVVKIGDSVLAEADDKAALVGPTPVSSSVILSISRIRQLLGFGKPLTLVTTVTSSSGEILDTHATPIDLGIFYSSTIPLALGIIVLALILFGLGVWIYRSRKSRLISGTVLVVLLGVIATPYRADARARSESYDIGPSCGMNYGENAANCQDPGTNSYIAAPYYHVVASGSCYVTLGTQTHPKFGEVPVNILDASATISSDLVYCSNAPYAINADGGMIDNYNSGAPAYYYSVRSEGTFAAYECSLNSSQGASTVTCSQYGSRFLSEDSVYITQTMKFNTRGNEPSLAQCDAILDACTIDMDVEACAAWQNQCSRAVRCWSCQDVSVLFSVDCGPDSGGPGIIGSSQQVGVYLPNQGSTSNQAPTAGQSSNQTNQSNQVPTTAGQNQDPGVNQVPTTAGQNQDPGVNQVPTTAGQNQDPGVNQNPNQDPTPSQVLSSQVVGSQLSVGGANQIGFNQGLTSLSSTNQSSNQANQANQVASINQSLSSISSSTSSNQGNQSATTASSLTSSSVSSSSTSSSLSSSSSTTGNQSSQLTSASSTGNQSSQLASTVNQTTLNQANQSLNQTSNQSSNQFPNQTINQNNQSGTSTSSSSNQSANQANQATSTSSSSSSSSLSSSTTGNQSSSSSSSSTTGNQSSSSISGNQSSGTTGNQSSGTNQSAGSMGPFFHFAVGSR